MATNIVNSDTRFRNRTHLVYNHGKDANGDRIISDSRWNQVVYKGMGTFWEPVDVAGGNTGGQGVTRNDKPTNRFEMTRVGVLGLRDPVNGSSNTSRDGGDICDPARG